MAIDDLHALFNLLVSPPESLLLLLQRCIICEDEASQLALYLQLTHHSENIVLDGQEAMAIINLIALHVLNHSFFISS